MSPESHAKQRAALADRVRRDFSASWGRVDPHAVRASWLAEIPRLLVTLTIAQQVAAASADAYVAAAVGSPAVRELVLGAFSHVASDGRALDSLLERPAVATIRALQLGEPLDRSMAAGALTAQLIGHTQVADAGRVADLTALTANPAATGYVRLVVGRTCARCMLLAGRRYSWRADFNRHPRRPDATARWSPRTMSGRVRSSLRSRRFARCCPRSRTGSSARPAPRRFEPAPTSDRWSMPGAG